MTRKFNKVVKTYHEIAIRNMYEFEGLRTDEIAEKLHISENEVVLTLEKYGLI